MNLRSLSISLALALLAVFAMLNWTAFITPTTLSIGFTNVQAPLGLIMLIATGLVCGLFVLYIVVQQAGVILEARRNAKELKSHRELADKAEASRFTELRSFIEGELGRLEAQDAAAARDLGAQVEQVKQVLLETLAESTRTLSAYVGEVDDKLDRLSGPANTPRS